MAIAILALGSRSREQAEQLRNRPVAPSRRMLMTLCIGAVIGLAGCASPVVTPSPSPTPTPTPRPTARLTPAPTPASDPAAPFRDLAGKRTFGTAIRMPALIDNPTYALTAETEFSSITPEAAMTWAAVEPTRGEFDWSYPDAIVTWANTRGIAVRGFPLVWDQGLPGWLTSGEFDAVTLTAMLHDHITAVVGHYAGRVASWDVVADAFNADGSLRRTLWEQAMGPDYIAQVLQWTHLADPQARLYLGDSDFEGLNTKSDTIYDLVKSLHERAVPIDGVGMEAHLDATARSSFPTAVAANIQRFAALGVDVAVTALDVRVHTPPLEGELDRQTAYYTSMVTACFSTPGCVGVTVWGFSDRYSWVPANFPGEGAADLWDSNFKPKPALLAVKQAIIASRR
jgi:endo-1,4-beta-xylanase